jgi:hypothetical protein
MNAGIFWGERRTCQKELIGASVIIDGSANDVPKFRCQMPFVDQEWPLTRQNHLWISFNILSDALTV